MLPADSFVLTSLFKRHPGLTFFTRHLPSEKDLQGNGLLSQRERKRRNQIKKNQSHLEIFIYFLSSREKNKYPRS